MQERTPEGGYVCFASTAPGLAPLVARELSTIGVTVADVEHDGVNFTGSASALYAANLWSRVASRVLVRIGAFRASAFYELERRAARLPWERFLSADVPVHVRVTCRKSRLYHSDAVAERVMRVMAAATGARTAAARGEDDGADAADVAAQIVVVRLVRDHCTVSVDSSGALLHRRGYRRATAKAPVRETLAAALLLASDWDAAGSAPLVDPMCGAGTIAIEAALIARGRAPGLGRTFAFERWPEFVPEAWAGVVAEARTRERIPVAGTPRIHASDRDAGAVAAAEANAERAEVSQDIELAVRPLSALAPPAGPGWLVTNPPYGVRIGEREGLRDLYARLGDVARTRCAGWTVAILSGDRMLAGHTGLPFTPQLHTTHGGLPVDILVARVPGSAGAGHL
jgi:putative N6-adenine-specific DNA methylase